MRVKQNKRARTLAILLTMLPAVGSWSGARVATNAPAWPLRAFPVAAWCSPPDAYINAEQYRRMAEAGFTLVMPPCEGAASVERNRKILDTARQTGLKAVVADPRMPLSLSQTPDGKQRLDAIVKEYHRSPALLGYFIMDEPGAAQFAGLAEVTAYLKEIDPEHVAYINVLPNYATSNQQAKTSQLGTDSYDQYLDKYMQNVKPDVLSFDHYGLMKDGDRPGFLGNLTSARRASAPNPSQPPTPFWQIAQAVEHGPYRALNENELRYEAMQTLVYGGKGLAYFTYWLPPDDATYTWKNSIMNRDGTPGRLYGGVTKVNRDIKTLTKYLFSANVLRTYQSGSVPEDGNALGNDAPVRIEGKGDLSLALFRDPKGYLYVLFTNRDYKNAVVTKAILDVKQHPVEMLDMESGKFQPVTEPRNADGEMSIGVTLAPAGAMLVRWL